MERGGVKTIECQEPSCPGSARAVDRDRSCGRTSPGPVSSSAPHCSSWAKSLTSCTKWPKRGTNKTKLIPIDVHAPTLFPTAQDTTAILSCETRLASSGAQHAASEDLVAWHARGGGALAPARTKLGRGKEVVDAGEVGRRAVGLALPQHLYQLLARCAELHQKSFDLLFPGEGVTPQGCKSRRSGMRARRRDAC